MAAAAKLPEGVTLADFVAYLPDHSYIFVPTGAFWSVEGVNACLPPVPVTRNGKPALHKQGRKKGEPMTVPATMWVDKNQPVHHLTWAPGYPTLIRNKLLVDGGWITRRGVTTFNFYRPPVRKPGNPKRATPWLDLVRKLFPQDWKRIVAFFAHCVQHPERKINHGLVIGGAPGIGKDTMIEPLKRAVGAWNCREVSPTNLLGRFNGYLKAVVTRVSELRDLGDFNKYQLYERSKTFLASPPDTLRVDEKNIPEHDVINVVAVLFTTNHLTDGMYLPPDDRRHDVMWSECTKDDFTDAYWKTLWDWYDNKGGDADVAAYLAGYDLSKFNPKAPPPKTEAFMQIVEANQAPEDSELADALDRMGNPQVVTIEQVLEHSPSNAYEQDSFRHWLRDRKNRRNIPHRFAKCGYVRVRNTAASDGLWRIDDVRQPIYGRAKLTVRDQLTAAQQLIAAKIEVAKAAARAAAERDARTIPLPPRRSKHNGNKGLGKGIKF